MSRCEVHTLNTSDSIIKYLADYLLNEIGVDNFYDTVIVFPGRRPRFFLFKELAARIGKSYVPPKYYAMDDFIYELLFSFENFSVLDANNSAYKVFKLIRKSECAQILDTESFAASFDVAFDIYSLFNSSFMELVNADKFAVLAGNWEKRGDMGTLLSDLRTAYCEFEKYMIIERRYCYGFIYKKIAEVLREIDFGKKRFLFCDFFYLSKSEQEIFSYFASNAVSSFIFCIGKDFKNEFLENFGFLLSNKLRNISFENNGIKNFSFYRASGLHSEAAMLGKILEKIENFSDTLIVVPDSERLVPLISEINGKCEKYNVSLGYPLSKSPLFALLNLITDIQITKTGAKYYAKDYIKTLKHPFVKNFSLCGKEYISRGIVHIIEEILLEDKSVFISETEIADGIAKHIFELNVRLKEMGYSEVSADEAIVHYRNINDIFFSSWENVDTFSKLSEIVFYFIENLSKGINFEKYPLNKAFLSRLYEYASALSEADYKDEVYTLSDIYKLFISQLSRYKVSFKGTPLHGLQILGPLESRSLSFENVIFFDMNEHVMPFVDTPFYVLPEVLLKRMGMRRFFKNEVIQYYNFRRLIDGASNLFFLYDTEIGERSRFIERFIWEREKRNGALADICEFEGKVNIKFGNTCSFIEKNGKTVSFLRDKFEYSPSSIDAYVRCPVSFYYTYLLRLKPKEDFMEDPAANIIGDFIHKYLEMLYKKFLNVGVAIDDSFVEEAICEFGNMFEEKISYRMRGDSFMLYKVMEYRIRKFFMKEASRKIDKIISLEKEYNGIISGVKFTAKVDRIEVSAGEVLVIDYKTGMGAHLPAKKDKIVNMGKFSREEIEKNIRSFQLPVYYTFVKDSIRGYGGIDMGLYLLRGAKIDLFSESVGETYPYDTVMPVIKEALAFVVNEICNPDIPFLKTNDKLKCRRCNYKNLCQ